MVMDGIVAACILLLTLHGYWKGFLRKLAGIGAIIIASLSVAFVGRALASFVSERWGMDATAIYIPAAVVGWLTVYIILRIILGFIARKLSTGGDGKQKPWNRDLGAFFGVIEGAALCWFVVGILDSLPADWRGQNLPRLNDQMKRSYFAQFTHETNPAAFLELRPLIADLVVVANDQAALHDLERDPALQPLLHQQKVKAIMGDKDLLQEVEDGRTARFLFDRKVREALEDPEVRTLLRQTPIREALHRAAESVREHKEAQKEEGKRK